MPSLSDVEDDPTPEEHVLSDEDIEEDFEPQFPDLTTSPGPSTSMTLPPLTELEQPPEKSVPKHETRALAIA